MPQKTSPPCSSRISCRSCVFCCVCVYVCVCLSVHACNRERQLKEALVPSLPLLNSPSTLFLHSPRCIRSPGRSQWSTPPGAGGRAGGRGRCRRPAYCSPRSTGSSQRAAPSSRPPRPPPMMMRRRTTRIARSGSCCRGWVQPPPPPPPSARRWQGVPVGVFGLSCGFACGTTASPGACVDANAGVLFGR